MNPELKQLCVITAISVPIGLVIGLLLKKTKPSWSKAYTKSCLNRKWWLFLGGLILFTGLSVLAFVTDRPFFGVFFIVFALLEAYCLVRYGFRHLSPEMADEIDVRYSTRMGEFKRSQQR